MVDARDRVRAAETDKLEVSARVFTALEARRQQRSARHDRHAEREPDAEGGARNLSSGSRFGGAVSQDQAAAAASHRRERGGEAGRNRPLTTCSPSSATRGRRVRQSPAPTRDRWRSGSAAHVESDADTFQQIAVLPEAPSGSPARGCVSRRSASRRAVGTLRRRQPALTRTTRRNSRTCRTPAS